MFGLAWSRPHRVSPPLNPIFLMTVSYHEGVSLTSEADQSSLQVYMSGVLTSLCESKVLVSVLLTLFLHLRAKKKRSMLCIIAAIVFLFSHAFSASSRVASSHWKPRRVTHLWRLRFRRQVLWFSAWRNTTRVSVPRIGKLM